MVPDELKKAIIPDEKFNRVMGNGYKNEESNFRIKACIIEWIELAIQKYLEGDASTWKAAEIAGVSLRIMIYIKILAI